MKERKKKTIALVLTLSVGCLIIIAVHTGAISFGHFPERQLGTPDNGITYQKALEMYQYNFEDNEIGFSENAIDQILENKPENFGSQSIGKNLLMYSTENTGATNSVTGVLWDLRGYDTVGEATVIFVAVAGVAALFRASKEEEE